MVNTWIYPGDSKPVRKTNSTVLTVLNNVLYFEDFISSPLILRRSSSAFLALYCAETSLLFASSMSF